MTINDQVRDEKLQYDVNREAAKISPLSSGKIDKYEYLTGEEILPSNQQQIIEQAKFTYSPLGKAFEKQTKTVEDQGEKQVNALKAITYKSDNSDNTSIIKEIYNKILEERMDKLLKMSREIEYKNLVYDFEGKTPSTHTYNQIKNGKKTLQQVEEEQKYFKKDLKEIKSGNLDHKSEKQLYTIKNVKNLYDSRQKIINLLNDNAKIRSEAIYKAKNYKKRRKGLKILTPNKCFKDC